MRGFLRDWRDWGFRTAVWNLRFGLAWRMLPGDDKHVELGWDENPPSDGIVPEREGR